MTLQHAHEALQRGLQRCVSHDQKSVNCESLTPTQGATQQSVDCESLTPTRGATQKSVDCESLTPTRGATQQSVDCESLTPTRGATQQKVGVKKTKGKESGRQNCILGDPQQRGAKSEVFPNKGEQNQKWPPLGVPKQGGNATSPHILGDPQHRGAKSEVAASPLPSQGPKRGLKCYVTPAFSGVPYGRGRKQKWPTKGRKCYVIPAFSGIPKQGDKVKGGPQVGGKAT